MSVVGDGLAGARYGILRSGGYLRIGVLMWCRAYGSQHTLTNVCDATECKGGEYVNVCEELGAGRELVPDAVLVAAETLHMYWDVTEARTCSLTGAPRVDY